MFYKILGISKKTGEGTIYTVLRGKSVTGEKSESVRTTGVTVKPTHFNTKTGKVKAKDLLSVEKNAKIQAVVNEIESAARTLSFNGLAPTREAITRSIVEDKSLSESISGVRQFISKTLSDECDHLRGIIHTLETQLQQTRKDLESKEMKLGIRPKPLLISELIRNFQQFKADTKQLRASSLKVYDVLRNVLIRYDSQSVLTDVNLEFFNNFQSHLIKRGVTNASILEMLGKFKTIFRYYAPKHGVDVTFLADFNAVQAGEANDVLFLTPEQLAELETLPLTGTAQIEVRRQFLFGVETGLRRSDYNISPSNINKNELILPTQKTGKMVHIPFTDKARNLFGNQSFRCFIEAQYNQALRAICKKMVTMKDDVTVYHKIGSVNHAETLPRWQWMSSHVARKTFAHNALSNGASKDAVAEWMGHRTTKMLDLHYTNKKELARQEAYKILK